ncbi:MAG: response regulator [Deltaproteobacteria bacterium]|nr:response regulator [Deltaproteobacteria bacterium]
MNILPPELTATDQELDRIGVEPLDFMVGRDILLVDDNQLNLVAIEAALGPLGRKLVLARSGAEALARLLEQDFALILLDVMMPDMDGFETARLVRSRHRNAGTPIIFITGMSWQDDEVLRGYELGAFDFLMKPIRPEVLRAKASVFVQLQERTLELHHKAAELQAAQSKAHERELIAQRRRFETDAMERQVAQMAETDRRKDEFLAILAHELRNPLQPLQTALEVIEHDPDRPVPARIRGIVQRQVHHITRLVDDLLDISRFTAGKLELRREPTSIDAIVEEAVVACRAAIDAHKHTVEIVSDDSKPMVHGDPVRLVQVLVNILSNAVKYTPVGGKIAIRSSSDGSTVRISVVDNGRGISDELLPTIFDMFVQERTTTDGAGGLGLGLGLVRRLVELHGGTVSARSAGPNLGSTFELCVPLMDAATPVTSQRTATGPRLRPLRAVVIDDAPDLRELLAELLRLRGHEVTTVAGGVAGVELICRERPDVALIDIGLPDMDGYEVARAIRRTLQDPSSPRLIAVTGYGQESDRASALAAGFDAHIVKPVNADGIMRALYGTQEDR